MERRELRLKILGEYGNIQNFCKDIGYSRQQISNILVGRVTGGLEFWNIAQQKLHLSDGEVWSFINNMAVGGDNEQNK